MYIRPTSSSSKRKAGELSSRKANYYFKQNDVGEKANACSKHRFSRVSSGAQRCEKPALSLLDSSFSYVNNVNDII